MRTILFESSICTICLSPHAFAAGLYDSRRLLGTRPIRSKVHALTTILLATYSDDFLLLAVDTLRIATHSSHLHSTSCRQQFGRWIDLHISRYRLDHSLTKTGQAAPLLPPSHLFQAFKQLSYHHFLLLGTLAGLEPDSTPHHALAGLELATSAFA